MLDGTHFFECECGADEHTLKFVYDKTDNELYLSVFLNQYRSWWKRIYIAIQYVFGYKCKYGHWDNWTMTSGDASRLHKLLEQVIDQAQESKDEQ